MSTTNGYDELSTQLDSNNKMSVQNCFTAMSADVTTTGGHTIKRLPEEVLVNQTFDISKDVWLQIERSTLNNFFDKLIVSGGADAGENNVRAYAWADTNQTEAIDQVKAILHECTVKNDPLARNEGNNDDSNGIFHMADAVNTALNAEFGGSDIVVRNNIQDEYQAKRNAGQGLYDKICDSNGYGSGDDEHKVTVDLSDSSDELSSSSVVLEGTLGSCELDLDILFKQIIHASDNNVNRVDSHDADDLFMVNDVLYLGNGSSTTITLAVEDLTDTPEDDHATNPTDTKLRSEMAEVNTHSDYKDGIQEAPADNVYQLDEQQIFIEVIADSS